MKASYFLASKYSEALIKTLEDKGEIGNLEKYVEAFRKLKSVLEEDEILRDTVYSPLISPDYIVKKFAEVAEFEEKIFVQFLEVLAKKRRQNLIPLISYILYQQNLERERVVEVRLILPKNVSKNIIDRIKNAIQSKTGREIKLITEIEEEIIGGLQLYIGDKFFDYSVKGFLDNIQSAYAPTGGGDNFWELIQMNLQR